MKGESGREREGRMGKQWRGNLNLPLQNHVYGNVHTERGKWEANPKKGRPGRGPDPPFGPDTDR